jgi:hypothetical protein
MLKPTAKSSGTAPVPTASMRVEKRTQIPGMDSREVRARNLVDHMKGEILMLVPETANGFRANIGSMRARV